MYKKIKRISDDGTITIFANIHQACENHPEYKPNSIYACARRGKKVYGYHWRVLEPYEEGEEVCRDGAPLLALVPEKHREKARLAMEQATKRLYTKDGVKAFAEWYMHQSKVFIPSDALVEAIRSLSWES